MKKLIHLFILLFFFLALPATVLAQAPDYSIHLARDFGYSAGADIRGNFTISLVGDLNAVQSVSYQMDGKEFASVSASPFRYSFRTSDYPSGWHSFSAVVQTRDGKQITTAGIQYHLLSASDESQSMQKVFIPLFGGILAILVIAVGAQFLMMRRHPERLAPGAPRSYGVKGGTICPRCGRAYAIHFFSVNLPGVYIDRCDYCGKVAFVRPRSRAELDAAVQAEAAAAQAGESFIPGVQAQQSEAERLKKIMDESKYSE